jgi:hypothetical protein
MNPASAVSPAGAPNASYGVFQYYGTNNLGDAIQTYSLTRLLPGRTRAIARRGCRGTWDVLVANGWLGNNRLPVTADQERCLFAGVFVAQAHNLRWLRRSRFPVGARDPVTNEKLKTNGITSELIGCASLTLPRYDGHRSGVYAVDCTCSNEIPPNAIVLTHHIGRRMNWRQQWTVAAHFLDLYRRASLVFTSRLHVALPCIAFGTPVVFYSPNPREICDPLAAERISLLRFLGVQDGVPARISSANLAARYLAFLERHLGISIIEHAARLPR